MTAARPAPGTDAGEWIDTLRRCPDAGDELVALLPENGPLFDGRDAPEATRIRGYVLAAFADAGMPDAALPYVRESLELGAEAYEIAGAAIGVRGHPDPPADVVAALGRAVRHLVAIDATVSFESYRPSWPFTSPTTGTQEVITTLVALASSHPTARAVLLGLAGESRRLPAAARARVAEAVAALPEDAPEPVHPCCSSTAVIPDGVGTGPVELEDQDGGHIGFDEFVVGRPSVVTFFHTRCENPYKCSATVSRLVALRRALDAGGPTVRIAGITYDPAFDRPDRLRTYGADRGLCFGPDTRFFRAVSGFDELRARFDLGVGYGASTVGRHRIELHVLDAGGRVTASFTRVGWEPEEVLAALDRASGS
ncbi:SCO family protein [Pseudonocardia endophytica]|uniref:Cytochrome oxidase Cu insertion factor (SCO1/SenC/PrrC family) n=1 Tax=Pseudonocardia endophytica TaxID=401976 RepID=A0A4R1HLF0_PSEEN|nr:SCO family protein [Pseudonocardia endophytica]TCK22798.1 cytochrome oxidase Cu insertion factor (SCO1/SenC/PrrC family) [Pseudonocardia endophytica]